MSKELEYFPPNTSTWQWGSKALNYSPWVCNLGAQMKPKTVGSIWPASVVLSVDLLGGEYVWSVKVTDWHGGQHMDVGRAATAKEAVASAEAAGERVFHALIPNWVFTALENGWRPPLSQAPRSGPREDGVVPKLLEDVIKKATGKVP